MSKRIWSMFGASAVAVMLASAATQGCAAEPTSSETPSTAAELPQGLTVLPTTTENTVSLAFKKGDHAIFIQAVRGKPTAPSYQMTEGAPKFEIDARFVADNGRVFYSRQGGDGWIDPTWQDEFARQQAMLKPTRVSNEALFAMADEAVKQFDAVLPAQLGARVKDLAPELTAIREFGEGAVVRFAEQKVKFLAQMTKLGKTVTEVPYGTNGPEDADWTIANASYNYMAVHDQGIDSTLGLGRPSASRIYGWTGSWQVVHDFCNHGSCASAMPQKCFLQYYEALTEFKAWTANTCKTGYDAFSNDGHNCHDDTRVQLSNFVYNKSNNGYQAWCADGDGGSDISSWPGDESGSPECDATPYKGYNYVGWCDYKYSNTSCPASYQGTGDGCDCGCNFPDGTMADPDCKNK